MSLLLANQTGGSTTHLAAVSFVASGNAAFNPERVQSGLLAEAGVGVTSFTSQRVQTASVGFVGGGVAAFNAVRTLVVSISFAAVGAFNAIAERIRGVSLAATGTATFGAAVEDASLAAVAFEAHATFDAAAGQVHAAQVSFGGEASVQAAADSGVTEQPASGGGGGVVTPRKPEPRRIRPRMLTASVAFRAEGIFAARATLVHSVAEIPLPWIEEELDAPPFTPAVIGHIESIPGWTEEEELVALLMFADAA